MFRISSTVNVLISYYEISTLTVDGQDVTFGKSTRGLGRSLPSPLLAVPKVTVHPSSASVPITVMLYSGPLHYGFNMPIKGLNESIYVNRPNLFINPAAHRSTR